MESLIENYTKKIKNKTVLDHINYVFEEGKIYGLYGRNGSGKTMLLRALCGLILPTEGHVKIDDKIIGKDIEMPDSVGVIIENMKMFPEYTAYKNLKILSQIKKKATDDDIRWALESVGLEEHANEKVKTFSLGMNQKLCIAQAIMEKPKILLLDEPTNALDQESIEKIRMLFIELKKQGSILIIASHNLQDLEMLSDKKIEMRNGLILIN